MRVRSRRKRYTLGCLIGFSLPLVVPSLVETFPFQGDLVIDGEPVITVLGKDAIPAIDRPQFVSVQEANRDFRDDEPVLGIRQGEVARAYSLWQLNHHEIVNDQVGDLPLAITW